MGGKGTLHSCAYRSTAFLGEVNMLGILLGLVASTMPVQAEPQNSAQSVQCDVGPLRRTFGGQPWLVYSCGDGVTLVIVSDMGNPAMPFVFMFTPRNDGYDVHGEGAGSKESSAAAFEELESFSA